MNYGLPTSVEVNGAEYEIRSDFRAVLDIIEVIASPEYTDAERVFGALAVFYPGLESIPSEDLQEAVKQCFWFINGGEQREQRGPKVVDWAQDFPRIVAPINRVVGRDIRSMEYLHWWTFLAAYGEIGDCLFAQIVSIRDKKARGKPLDKQDREFYRRNKDIIDIKKPLTEAEDELLSQWLGKSK